jgi:hypothetical protein
VGPHFEHTSSELRDARNAQSPIVLIASFALGEFFATQSDFAMPLYSSATLGKRQG